MWKSIDITGLRFWRLLVVSEIWRDKYRNVLWICKCSCGNETIASWINIRNWFTLSCGCYNIEQSTTHWLSKHRLYKIWKNMIDRCNNKKHKYYKDYWWRWIRVCDIWMLSPQNFINDMEKWWNKWLQIDRIDNNWNYSKDNCRWVTSKDNCRNRRNNLMITHNWETHCISEWSDITWININTILWRFNNWWSVDKLLRTF